MKIFNRGTALVEFALILPILILLSFGMFDLYNYISMNTYIKTAAYRLMLWNSQNISTTNMNNTITCINNEGFLKTSTSPTNATIIITAVQTGGTSNKTISRVVSGPNSPEKSQVSSTYPNLNSGDGNNGINTVVVEVFYTYTPLFYQFLPNSMSYTGCIDFRGDPSTFGRSGNGNHD